MAGRNTLVVASVAAALALAAILGMLGMLLVRPAAAQAPAGEAAVRQITVVGRGEARGAPDRASINLGVETRGATAAEALAQNNTQMAALVAKLKELGIQGADIQTSGFNVGTDYDYEARQVRGYIVSNSVAVTVRDLASVGSLLDQMVQAGANNIYGISFSVADTKALEAAAREQAIADAKERAEQMAQAAGVSLGEVLVVSEVVGGVTPMPMMADAMLSEKAGAPVEPGSLGFSAQVQVSFALR
jgi:hypothetical protein